MNECQYEDNMVIIWSILKAKDFILCLHVCLCFKIRIRLLCTTRIWKSLFEYLLQKAHTKWSCANAWHCYQQQIDISVLVWYCERNKWIKTILEFRKSHNHGVWRYKSRVFLNAYICIIHINLILIESPYPPHQTNRKVTHFLCVSESKHHWFT